MTMTSNKTLSKGDASKRKEIEANGYLISPSSLDSEAVMVLDSNGNYLDLHYPDSIEERQALIKDFNWLEAKKS